MGKLLLIALVFALASCQKSSSPGVWYPSDPGPVEWTDLPKDLCQNPAPETLRRPRQAQWEGIYLEGSDAFVTCTLEALEKAQTTAAFQKVRPFLFFIREGEHSGVTPLGLPLPRRGARFDVGERTWRRSVVWYASAIVHDAGHARLYYEHRPWNGPEGERACLEIQRDALVALKAKPEWIAYVEAQAQHPQYQDIDESQRNWAR